MSAVAEKIKKIVAENLNVSEDQVKPEAKFIEDLGADSLDLVAQVLSKRKSVRLPMDFNWPFS